VGTFSDIEDAPSIYQLLHLLNKPLKESCKILKISTFS